MNARMYAVKYRPESVKYDEPVFHMIKATDRWVEYMLDKYDINKILMQQDFNTKMELLEVLDILDKKIAYMYRHPNFDFKRATYLFNRVKGSQKVV
jgi:hypothetical protein